MVYSGFRVVLCDGAESEFLEASGAVMAGRSPVTTLAKLLLLGPLTNAVSGKPQHGARNVVDDISLQSFGPAGLIVGRHPVADEQPMESFAASRLPVNMSKCTFFFSATLSWQLDCAMNGRCRSGFMRTALAISEQMPT